MKRNKEQDLITEAGQAALKISRVGGMSRKWCSFTAVLAVAFLFALLLTGCSGERTFKHCEMGITLPREFHEAESELFDLALTDGTVTVGFTRLSFAAGVDDGMSPNLDPYAFGAYYLEKIGATASLEEQGYTPYARLDVNSDGTPLSQILSFYRTDYAYFVISFISPYPLTSTNKQDILSYIDNVFYLDQEG